MSDETAFEIYGWYIARSQPNTQRAYCECPVCHSTWWKTEGLFGLEIHNVDCWIPHLQNDVKEINSHT